MRVEAEPHVLALHRALVTEGVVSPLVLGGAEEALWSDCDLASLAENRLGDATDPRALSTELRAEWRERATTEPWRSPAERSIDACFWLLDGTNQVGTVALSRGLFGNPLLRLSSLYVLPTHRRGGIATRALDRLRAVLGGHRRGIRLETHWTWQSAASFYLRRGFWVRMWKRDLEFYAPPNAPPAIVHVDDERAFIEVELGGEKVVLARAERDGDQLRLEDIEDRVDVRLQELAWDASPTLSLALALRGWPLIRSPEAWDRCRHSDTGPPEALAYKIAIWEAWDRKHGFRVETPRIPGLEYPSWEEFEARWADPSA